MVDHTQNPRRPLALVILDGWGFSTRKEGNAIAAAHTPNYDRICKRYPMTTLTASGTGVGQAAGEPGNPEVGHLNLGTGRPAQTEVERVRSAVMSGEFQKNEVLNTAFAHAKEKGSDVHLIGLLSDAGVHSSTENLFAIIRLAKKHGLTKVFIHGILDGLDVPARTADVYVDAIEIKLADIGLGRIATLCGRYFGMDTADRWERTARAFTMLVHAEGERNTDAVSAIRNSFLRGISDEFITPIVIESEPGTAMAKVKGGDLVVFFNHRADGMRQLVRSLCIADESASVKPIVDSVCLVEYDRAFDLPAAFRQTPQMGTLTEALSAKEIFNQKITEAARFQHLTHFFDGGADPTQPFEEVVLVPGAPPSPERPESQSFKIADRVLRGLEGSPSGVFVANLPAADLGSPGGSFEQTVAAIQFVDTCLGGICDAVREAGGIVLVTSSHGGCEEISAAGGERRGRATSNPVPFHLIDDSGENLFLRESGVLADVAPTILGVLGIEKPPQMTGSDLRVL